MHSAKFITVVPFFLIWPTNRSFFFFSVRLQMQPSLPKRIDYSAKNPAEIYLSGLSSSASERTMRSCLNNAARLFGFTHLLDVEWKALRRQHIQYVIDQLRIKKYASSTINLYIAALKGVAKEAWMSDLMPHGAYLKITTIKSIQFQRLPTGRSMTLRECRRLLSSCSNGSVKDVRDKAMLGVMMGCGMRRAEIVNLTIDHWDNVEKAFTFIGKGNKQRLVYLPPDLNPDMNAWLKVRGDDAGPLFPRIFKCQGQEKMDLTKHMRPASIYRLVQNRSTRAGIREVTPHDFRRTFATRTLEAGIDIFVLQGAMGHASPTTTRRYDRRDAKALAKAARALRF